MTAPLFKGVITALITPLRDGNVDEAALERLVERQIAAGVHGIVAVGRLVLAGRARRLILVGFGVVVRILVLRAI